MDDTNRLQTCQRKWFYDAAIRDVHASTKYCISSSSLDGMTWCQAPAFLLNLGVDLPADDRLTSSGAGLKKKLCTLVAQAMRKCLVTPPSYIHSGHSMLVNLLLSPYLKNRGNGLQLYDNITLVVPETLSPSTAGLQGFIWFLLLRYLLLCPHHLNLAPHSRIPFCG